MRAISNLAMGFGGGHWLMGAIVSLFTPIHTRSGPLPFSHCAAIALGGAMVMVLGALLRVEDEKLQMVRMRMTNDQQEAQTCD